MVLECPICGQKLAQTDPACAGCGYPLALHPEARRGGEEGEAPPPPRSGGSARAGPSRRAALSSVRASDQTSEACNRSARELLGHLEILQQLGGSPQSFLGEMRQAALVQAEGKPAESLELLRAAEGRASREVGELFGRRSQELEARAKLLSDQGVQPDVAGTIARLHAGLAESDRAEAARRVIEADRRLGSLEQDLRGIHELLGQIDALREGARSAGHPIEDVEKDIAQVRELLARPKVDAEVLDTAAQVAARALMLLNESLPTILEADLERAGSALDELPGEHERTRQARAIHSEASRHLRRGRLPEAAARLAELRRTLRGLESPTVARPSAPPAAVAAVVVAGAAEAVSVPPPATADPLPKLLAKARTLATRVRALAPESELAFEAAGEIRRATELLRARKLEEADSTLTRLMRTLDAESGPEG